MPNVEDTKPPGSAAPLRPADDKAQARDKLHVSVASAIEAQILSGQLHIGDRLSSEGEIARDFAVSTRSVREAMQVLETKGLVRRRHGGRATVVRDDVGEFLGTLAITVRQRFSTDPHYLIQLMVVRRMIETEVLGILIQRKDAGIGEVETALEAMRIARETQDFAGFTEADASFHLALVHAAGNEILSVFYDNLYGLIGDVIRVTSRVPSKSLEAAYAEHADIVMRIRDGDEAGAKALMRAHIDNSAAYLRVAIDRANQGKTQDG